MRPSAKTPEIALVCESGAMRRFATELENVAPGDMPVLIWGEPGAGKERAARALHRCSGRGAEPFEVLRCSGLDGAALQAALADVLPRARSGSVLLDGVEELDAAAQIELLRVLQSPLALRSSGPSLRRLGQAPRWISNAAEDLEPLVRRGRLRRDLYHRLRGTKEGNALQAGGTPRRERMACHVKGTEQRKSVDFATACASWWTSTLLRPTRSAWCWTT